jgi:hypothetical protein
MVLRCRTMEAVNGARDHALFGSIHAGMSKPSVIENEVGLGISGQEGRISWIRRLRGLLLRT